MNPLLDCSLYMSHSWSIGDARGKIARVLGATPGLNLRLVGLDADDPVHLAADYELRAEIRKIMTSCQMLLVNAAGHGRLARWIDEEIDLARGGFSHRRPVVVIVPFGSESYGELLRRSADAVLPWRSHDIQECIVRMAGLPLEPVKPHEHARAGTSTGAAWHAEEERSQPALPKLMGSAATRPVPAPRRTGFGTRGHAGGPTRLR